MSYSDTRNRISETAHEATDSSKQFVAEHPMSTGLAAFGLGLGVGVAVTFLLSGSRTREEAGLARRLGRQVLDAMSHAVPESLSKLGR